MEMIVYLIFGTLAGVLGTLVFLSTRKPFGVLRIDHSDPDKDVYRLEICDLDRLLRKKRVVLKVDKDAKL